MPIKSSSEKTASAVDNVRRCILKIEAEQNYCNQSVILIKSAIAEWTKHQKELSFAVSSMKRWLDRVNIESIHKIAPLETVKPAVEEEDPYEYDPDECNPFPTEEQWARIKTGHVTLENQINENILAWKRSVAEGNEDEN